MGKCRIQNIVPLCGYSVEGIDAIRLLDFDDFDGFKFDGDDLYNNCLVTAVFRSGNFVEMYSPDTAKYSSSFQNGVYTHTLETFIGDLSAELEAALHIATKRRYIVLFRAKNGRYFAFAYEAGASVSYTNQTSGGAGASVTISTTSIYPLFGVLVDAFSDKNTYRAIWLPDYAEYGLCEDVNGSNTGNQLATVLFRISTPGGTALDKNDNPVSPPAKQAIAVLSGQSNPDTGKYEIVHTYGPREIVGGVDTVRYNVNSCPAARDVTIIFYGNGGQTSEGQNVIQITAQEGTEWKNILKPEFLQAGTAKKQNGFTLVADDDNTLVTPDYIITGDMEVWASYTVVEIGVITARGEVMSVESWVEKYGNVCWNYDHISWNLVEEHRLDLVHFLYFKDGDNSFAISIKYGSPTLSVDASSNKEFGGMGVLLSSVPSFNIRTLKNQYSYIVKKYAMFDPSSPDFSTTENLGVQPWMLDMMRQYKDGKAYSYNYFTELGGACPIMAEISQWNVNPAIDTNSFYVAMPEQIQAVFRNKSKVLNVVEQLEEWEMNLTGTSNRYMYGFRPENSTFEGGFLSIKYYLTNYVNDFIIPIQYTTGYYDMDSHIVSETYNDHLALYSPVLEDISYTTYQGISTFNTIQKDHAGDLPAKLIVCDVNHLF